MRFSPSARACRLTFPPMLRIMKAPKGVFFMRHAWLILTHGNFEILEKQLRFLDSENADFYIHADAKTAFDPERFRAVPEKSRVTFVKRHRISWGHFAMVEAELELLRAAVPGGYDYYHLLSGVDVPVKTRAYIENYFTRAPGRNYVSFLSPEISRTDLYRVRFYYPLQRYNIRKPAVRRTLRNLSAALQLGFGVDRTRRRPDGFVFQKGAQWFSITHALAQYLLEKESEIREFFSDTYCPDEMFVQTEIVNSPFRDTLPEHAFENDYASCLRYIDWQRAIPTHSRTATSMNFSPHRKRRSSRGSLITARAPASLTRSLTVSDNFLSGARMFFRAPFFVLADGRHIWYSVSIWCICQAAHILCAKPQSVRSFRERE